MCVEISLILLKVSINIGMLSRKAVYLLCVCYSKRRWLIYCSGYRVLIKGNNKYFIRVDQDSMNINLRDDR